MFCDECTKCAKKHGQEGLIKVEAEPDQWIFTVESTGSLPPTTIVSQAFQIMLNKIRDVKIEIESMDG